MARQRHPSLQGRKQYAILFPMAVFVAIDQQVIHGHVIAFTPHFAFAIALASVCSFLFASFLVLPPREGHETGEMNWWLLLPLGASVLMLGGITWDNRHVLKQFTIRSARFNEQHFATLLPVLDALPRTRILSDDSTSAFIAASTRHDIVSSIYLESAFLSSEEIAERWCLTVLPLAPEERHIRERVHLVWPDANAANRGTDAREREVRLVEEACRRVDADPAGALEKYGVRYALWDVKQRLWWDPRKFKMPLVRVAEDQGKWELYKVGG
jgi:hypothetical protein